MNQKREGRINNEKNKRKDLFRRKLQEKGITLVALVITIIILIILATVAINFAFGNNGLIKRAEDARDYYANDTSYTDESITNVESYLDEIINGVGSGTGGSGSGGTTDDGVPIPDGFYYVGGTKEEGVVISDNPADENKGTSHEVAQTLEGNQFVWIPVEEDSLFKRYLGYSEGELDTDFPLEDYSEPFDKGYDTEAEEYEAMKTSVLENNGFYVGRYEAGTTVTRTEDSGITDPVVIKQGVNVYNYIGWNNSDDMINEKGGAVELAKKFADTNGYTSVISTLIYGIQWDAIMNFIDPAYATGSCEEDSFVRDSNGKGNYSGSPATTGSNANYAVKNIYDLGGNVDEWTMEAYSTRGRLGRGRLLQRFWI